jgi:hypothetical protein
MKRKLPSFLDAFTTYHEGMDVPKIFVRWTGLWTLSVMLERRVWTYTKKSRLFPNMFVYLVGIAGLGKTETIITAKSIINAVDHTLLGPDNITGAFLADAIRDGERQIITPKGAETYYSTSFLTSDLQTMLGVWDDGIIAKLTHLYDAKDYAEGRRSSKKDDDRTFYRDKVCLNMLAGTTPSFLRNNLPVTIWGHGYMSRVVIVFSGETERSSLFADEDEGKAAASLGELINEAKAIRENSFGPFSFTPEARELVDAFWRHPGLQGGPPIPTDARLQSYTTRRPAHLLKLMQLFHIDRTSTDMILTAEDYQKAYEFMVETEALMPEAFVGQRGDSAQAVVDQFLDWMVKARVFYKKHGCEGKVPKSKAKEWLRHNMTEQESYNTLRSLENEGVLRESKTSLGPMLELKKDPRDWL